MTPRVEHRCFKGHWTGPAHCYLCGVALSMPFKALAAGPLAASLRAVQSYDVPAGTTVLMSGQPATEVFSIRIKLWRLDDAGRNRIVRLMRPGDILGLEAALQDEYELSAAAVSPVKLCRIPAELITRLKTEEPAVFLEVERRWHTQLVHADALASSVLTGSSRERVLKLLRYMAKFAAPDPCPRIQRLDMAAILDISSETAARVIADLKHAGLLEEHPNELRFDPDRLVLGN
jgi:CRP/FNR family transcriptional regulator, anaerobic regulatory protein